MLVLLLNGSVEIRRDYFERPLLTLVGKDAKSFSKSVRQFRLEKNRAEKLVEKYLRAFDLKNDDRYLDLANKAKEEYTNICKRYDNAVNEVIRDKHITK